jgi:hypothetical protein
MKCCPNGHYFALHSHMKRPLHAGGVLHYLLNKGCAWTPPYLDRRGEMEQIHELISRKYI